MKWSADEDVRGQSSFGAELCRVREGSMQSVLSLQDREDLSSCLSHGHGF